MSRLIDLTNQKFGKLTVLERDYETKKKGTYWKCQCDCGNIVSVLSQHLRSGHTKSCGCLKEENLIGQRFHKVVVLKKDEEKSGQNNGLYWICQCDCGNIFSTQGRELRSGHTKSCGCLKKEKAIETHTKNLLGHKFEKLLVIDYDNNKDKSGAYWICQCDCGTIKSVRGSNLLQGRTQSCGCLKSTGELKIKEILNSLSIEFEYQKRYSDLYGDASQLSFDFYLPLYNTLIEFQGIQHYEPRIHYGGEENYERQKRYDELKREYCKKNNIHLIEIPYYEYQKIDEDYITKLIGGDHYFEQTLESGRKDYYTQ